MTELMSDNDARAALAAAERGRRQVIDQIDMPRWYWWSIALGWIVLAWLTDLRIAWLTLVATFVFGAAHSAIFNIVGAGRRKSSRLSVRADTIGWYAPVAVLASMIALAAVTVAGALLAEADGARHPVTVASIPVAVAIVLGGPTLMAYLRRRASRSHVVA
jgi:lysylphosphatidylglycerol synthetase-like protein (DUF2156 family)